MSIYDYVADIVDSPHQFMTLLILVFLSFMTINKIIFGKLINGVIGIQLSTYFVLTAILHLFIINAININSLSHYLIAEGSIYLILILVYKKIIINRINFRKSLDYFYSHYSIIPILFVLFRIIINFMNYSGEGSRIEFQTAYWFTLIKPLNSIFYPMIELGFFVHLGRNSKKYASLYLMLMIISSISSGSRSSFILGMIMWFFVYRDIYDVNLKNQVRKYVVVAIIATGAAILNLIYREMNLFGIVERIISYGDAAIMLYQESDPTLACSNLSYLALMHRGLARLLGDVGANNIDTLFGFAVHIQFYGSNTFTGPNARLGPYILCAFPNLSMILFIFMFSIYITMIMRLVGKNNNQVRQAFFFPFVIGSISSCMVDYNVLAGDISIMLMIFIFLTAINLLKIKHKI